MLEFLELFSELLPSVPKLAFGELILDPPAPPGGVLSAPESDVDVDDDGVRARESDGAKEKIFPRIPCVPAAVGLLIPGLSCKGIPFASTPARDCFGVERGGMSTEMPISPEAFFPFSGGVLLNRTGFNAGVAFLAALLFFSSFLGAIFLGS